MRAFASVSLVDGAADGETATGAGATAPSDRGPFKIEGTPGLGVQRGRDGREQAQKQEPYHAGFHIQRELFMVTWLVDSPGYH